MEVCGEYVTKVLAHRPSIAGSHDASYEKIPAYCDCLEENFK